MKSWKVNREVAPPKSKEHGLMKVGLKSWKVGMSQAKKGEFKKQRKKKKKKAEKWVTARCGKTGGLDSGLRVKRVRS